MKVIKISKQLKVRKQFILDPAKIKAIKKITRAKTDTEAINQALDILIVNSKIEKMLMSIKGKGKIKDVYGRVPG
ncbi:MAG: hypothetical protein A2042_05535 [Candidatus Schekmanbacteria bacterium GWA2_38_11]|uniref:Uncharacterized protein n=1 Tax=Candidatus Schekmanbacteria bacterium GWA2_38_11 TaxID=1817876 RepID=A0A1F7RFN3_9BACT|nr:MAG: hypothetical protein A2042_05535 [Candidatus Schekmanbacteria bacterium GWA2_38_11]